MTYQNALLRGAARVNLSCDVVDGSLHISIGNWMGFEPIIAKPGERITIETDGHEVIVKRASDDHDPK